MAPSSASQPAYGKDEKVLCFHHELLYEAKVTDSKVKDPNDKNGGFMYQVHYKGWKKSWDDWVPQERLRKFTEENNELARNLKKDMNAQRQAVAGKFPSLSTKKRPYGSDLAGSSARGSEDRSSAAPQPPKGTKRAREIEGIDKIVSTGFQQELTAKQEESFVNRPAVRLFMPDHLKSILVDDWEKVTKDSKLAAVPSPAPITKFLNEYYAFESNNRRPGSPEADMLEEFIAGIKEYFNQALGRMLLYRFERQQLHDVRKQIGSGHGEHAGKSFADMYGCEHLLRLFVSLPDLIAHTNMDTQAISRMREELTKITQWLAKRVDKYIYAPYEHAGQEYLDSAKNAA